MAAAAGIAGLGLGLGGTAYGTAAKVQQLKSIQQNAEIEAQNVEQQAALEERQYRRQAKLAMSEGVATIAGSGLSTKSGSPLMLQLDAAKQAELEAQAIRRSGTMQAASLRYGGRLAKSAITPTIVGGVAQGGSILSGFFGGGGSMKGSGFGAA